MKNTAIKTIGIGLALVALGTFSCKKEVKTPDPEPSQFSVNMTDAPGPYTAVNVDIQGVEITGSGGSVNLAVNPGIYNLLNFTNGVDTMIATGSLNMESVQQIRLILGDNNSVVTGSVSYPMKVSSGSESGLKIQVHQDLQPGVAYEVLLDFDANKSVNEEGNGKYSLKPVIRSIETALSGSIKGKLIPGGVNASISASAGGNVYSSSPNLAGDFIIAGLPAGVYNVTVTPVSPYSVHTINSVTVNVGSSTNTGTLGL